MDATTVKEPGPSGSLWRLHYSVGLPSLTCDFFKLTGTEGPGTGESLAQFPIRVGDHVLADRGYSTARGIRHVVDAGGRLIVRISVEVDHRFRRKWITCFGRSGSPISAEVDRFRPNWITQFPGS